jgi:hypothetical protein
MGEGETTVKFIRYPKIGQFRNLIEGLILHLTYAGKDETGEPIYEKDRELEAIKFKGTCKLHGTNAGIVFKNDDIWFQKRKSVVTPKNDNFGFATFYSNSERLERLKELRDRIRKHFGIPENYTLAVFGEWAGLKIQNGVGISQLPKAFYLFGIKTSFAEEVKWYPCEGFRDHNINIFNVEDYETHEITLDLRHPELVQEKLLEITERVEKECPISKAFGIENGLGEGIVWKAFVKGDLHCFKVKGDKHASVKGGKKEKVAILPAKLASIVEFVDYAVTNSRLEQAYHELFTANNIKPTKKHTGEMIKWIRNDVAEEELDVLTESELTLKDIGGTLAGLTKDWFFAKVDMF